MEEENNATFIFKILVLMGILLVGKFYAVPMATPLPAPPATLELTKKAENDTLRSDLPARRVGYPRY